MSKQSGGRGREQQSEYLERLANESCRLLLRHVWAVLLAEQRPCQVIAEACTPQAYHTSEATWPEALYLCQCTLLIVTWLDSPCP